MRGTMRGTVRGSTSFTCFLSAVRGTMRGNTHKKKIPGISILPKIFPAV